MDAVKCPINSYEWYFITMVTTLILYCVCSLLTCKEPYNLDRMLHRGKYAIDGKRIFAFGGAASHDREYRSEGLNWWATETAQPDEISRAYTNLAACANQTDYLVTHTPPDMVMRPVSRT